jgi:hypothetical protein
LSVITFTSNAQTPGYMGKKFIAKVELLTTPTFYKLNDINEYETYEDAVLLLMVLDLVSLLQLELNMLLAKEFRQVLL